jgi:CRP-like cAMP-binding protein
MVKSMIAATPVLRDALTAIPVLAGISPAAHAILAQEGIVHDFPAGVWIVREGDEGHSLFILVEGHVEVVKHADSPHPTSLAQLAQGSFFGEMCVVEPMRRAASVRALAPVRAIEIKAATLHHLFQKMPEQNAIVLLNIARDMARRLREIDDAYSARAS